MVLHRPLEPAAETGQVAWSPGSRFAKAAHSSISQEFFAVGQLCSHIVNTNSQIGTIRDSYLALSCPVKSDLASFPVPITAPNSFPFCTSTLSIFKFRVTPLSAAFTPHLLLSPLSTAFTQITGVYPLRKKNERHETQHHQRNCNDRNSPLPASLSERPLPPTRHRPCRNSLLRSRPRRAAS